MTDTKINRLIAEHIMGFGDRVGVVHRRSRGMHVYVAEGTDFAEEAQPDPSFPDEKCSLWGYRKFPDHVPASNVHVHGLGEWTELRGIPSFTTDMTTAWFVVDQLGDDGYDVKVNISPLLRDENRGVQVIVQKDPDVNVRGYGVAYSNNGAEAICRAALQAQGLLPRI